MNNLFTYVSAIKFGSEKYSIEHQELHDRSYYDEDMYIDSKEKVVHFSNGVVLKEHVEFDSEQSNDLDICPECWITYQVIEQPEGVSIRPNKKSFISRCKSLFG